MDYGVTKDSETIDYEEVRRVALKEQPKLIVAGASAYPRVIDFCEICEIADEVGILHGGYGSYCRTCSGR